MTNTEYIKARDAAAEKFADEIYNRNGSVPNQYWVERQTTWVRGADWGRAYESRRSQRLRDAVQQFLDDMSYTALNLSHALNAYDLDIYDAERAGSGET